MSEVTTTEPIPFSRALRAATEDVHDEAQQSPYIVALLGGDLTLAGYAALATQYYLIYSALESAADAMRDHPVVGAFVTDDLHRVPALTTDLYALLGPDWRDHVTPTPATVEYTERLATVAAAEPTAFVAHHYTRYLGDIAGGQVIRSRLKSQHGITDAGARFYDFSAIGPAPAFRDRYRALLDTTPWSDGERQEVIAETRRAYALNTAVFTDLAAVLHRYRVA